MSSTSWESFEAFLKERTQHLSEQGRHTELRETAIACAELVSRPGARPPLPSREVILNDPIEREKHHQGLNSAAAAATVIGIRVSGRHAFAWLARFHVLRKDPQEAVLRTADCAWRAADEAQRAELERVLRERLA